MSQSLLPFILFALVSSISPGPTNLLILAHGARRGLRASLAPIVARHLSRLDSLTCYSNAFATTDAGGGSGGTTRSMTIAAPVSGATSFNRPSASASMR